MSGPNPSLRDRQRLDVRLFRAKPQIESMILSGAADALVAETVGVPAAFAARCRNAIEIALPGGAGPKPWSAQDDAAVLYFRDEKGLGWTVIGRRLGREAKDISLRYDYLDRLQARKERKEAESIRKCHLCREEFVSWGKGNRRCDACKEDNDWLGDTAYYGAGAGEGILAGVPDQSPVYPPLDAGTEDASRAGGEGEGLLS